MIKPLIDSEEERPDISKKRKDCFNSLAAIVVNEEVNVEHKIRARAKKL